MKNPIAFWAGIISLLALVGGIFWAAAHFSNDDKSVTPAPAPVIEEPEVPKADCVDQCQIELKTCLEVICARMEDGRIEDPGAGLQRYQAASLICIGNAHPNMVACKDCIMAQPEYFTPIASQTAECQF